MKNSPFAIFNKFYNKHLSYCKENSIENPNAVYLATSSSDAIPTLRAVLVKEVTKDGFIFYTNTQSVKGAQLLENPNAAMLFHWNYKGMQIRVEGTVSLLKNSESDSYFATRPRMSKIGAHASKQSQVIKVPLGLMKRVSYFTLRFKLTKDKDIPRPLHWKGFILKPKKFEFWQEGNFRIHKRHQYSLKDGAWVKEVLFP